MVISVLAFRYINRAHSAMNFVFWGFPTKLDHNKGHVWHVKLVNARKRTFLIVCIFNIVIRLVTNAFGILVPVYTGQYARLLVGSVRAGANFLAIMCFGIAMSKTVLDKTLSFFNGMFTFNRKLGKCANFKTQINIQLVSRCPEQPGTSTDLNLWSGMTWIECWWPLNSRPSA